jgi:hypothetical protein
MTAESLLPTYRELVKPKDAERYWNIGPGTPEKVVPLMAQSHGL